MSLKCLRGLDSEVVDFQILGEDYRKLAMVCEDRNIEIHTQAGKHFKTRVPKIPRCSFYDQFSADLMVGCSGNQVHRLNLEEGQFIANLDTVENGVNSIIGNKFLELTVLGEDNGVIELVDMRSASRPGFIKLETQQNIQVLQNGKNPFEFYMGSSEGLLRLYDLRFSKYISEKRHPYMLPINSIELHGDRIVSSDKKQIRIMDKDLKTPFLNFEPLHNINKIACFDQSGLILAANEHSKCGIFFLPSLGHAPKFCEFVENFTEELEGNQKGA